MVKEAKLILMYPKPSIVSNLEDRFKQEHLPLIIDNLDGKSYLVHSFVVEPSPGNDLMPYHRIAEIYFASIVELEAWLGFPAGSCVIEHAFEIPTDGSPLLLAEEFETVQAYFFY